MKKEVAYLLLVIFLLTANGAKIPAAGVPSFIRSAVESIPQFDEGTLAKYSLKPSFGEVFLPLRSAVESSPSVGPAEYNVGKTFVRSSVEYNPQDDYEPVAEESHPHAVYVEGPLTEESHPEAVYVEKPSYGNEKYAAFILPTGYDQYPAPYRSDSPYQSLVGYSPNAASVSIEQEHFGVRDLYKKKKDFTEKPKVLCYVTNWSFYRTKDGKFAPENLDTKLCTALIYSFASLDPKTLMIKEFDPWVDLENDIYKRYTALDIPVLIAMGGWTDSTGDKYSNLVSSQSARQTFASNLVSFINQYGFSGFHFDWNYPKCWQSDCKKGPASDKPNLTKLIQEIRTQFDRINPDLQLGIAISGYKEVITEGYDLRALSEYADYLTVMSYDYHGAWEHQTGHVSPLYGRPGDKYPQYNTDYTIQLLLKSGAAKEKLIMGVPFYGQTYTLKETYYNVVGEGIPSVGPGEPGEFTKQPGMMAYYEICHRVRKNKWQVGRDSSRKSGPHAMLRNQWVGYEDPASVEAKARYALNSGLGGIAAWTVDLDDFLNRCCSESFPLLKAINRALGLLSTPPPSGSNCQRPPEPVTPVAPVMTTVADGNLPGGIHEHTTWPSWQPKPTSTKKPATTNWPTWSSSKRTTAAEITSTTSMTTTPTTTRRPPTTTKRPTTSTTWWQPTSTEASTWWPKPSSTTTSTTSRRPTVATTPSTTRATRRPTTTTSWTTRRPIQHTTIIPSPAVVMPISSPDGEKCEDGQYKPHPTICSNYYQCVYNIMTLQSCPGGLKWHAEGHRCDWPQNAKCKITQKEEVAPSKPGPTKPNPTKPPNVWWTSTTTRKTTPKTTSRRTTRKSTTVRPVAIMSSTSSRPSDEQCQNGMYYPHEDCEAFYICINGKLTPMHCGPGLQWNTKETSCDWEDNVRCISKSTYLRLVNFRANADDPCEGSQFIPYPGDCEQFLICVHNRLEVSQCAPGLHWNNDLKICDWPKRSGCQDGQEGEYPGVDQEQNVIDTRPIYSPPSTTTTSTTPRPTYPTNRPNLQPLSGYYKVVCYFTNWAWYRRGLAKYTPDDIDTNLCTHIVYGFAVLDYSELTIRTHDSWADIDNKFYQRVADLKNKGVKVTLALGGWNDSQGDKYSRLVRNPAARAKFVRQSIEFVEKYGFEGLDLDWEYPVCWQTECNKGFPDEKEGFTALVRELSEAYKPRGLLLSSAVSPSKKIIDAGYDVPELSKYFDWIAVMTYDFHGQWDKKTGHVAPLYYHPEDDIDYFNANFSINYWMEKGAPSRKLVMGMPLYGQSFTLSDTRNTGLNAHAPGPGQAGEFTRAAGFLAYYEICDRIKSRDWQVVKDEYGRIGPYAYKGNQWVSFDDKETLRRKSQLVRSLNLGGGMVWALDLDDFRNRCGEGVHPLLTTIRNVLKDPPKGHEHPPEPPQYPENPNEPEEGDGQFIATADNEAEIIEASEGTGTAAENEIVDQPEIDPNLEVEEVQEAGPGPEEIEGQEPSGATSITDDFKVICYFTNWAWYRQSGGKYLPEDIDPDLCTHIVYGFAVLNRDSLTIKSHDPWADVDNKFYERVVALKSKGKKVTVAIGGWNDSAGDKYSRLVRDQNARARFVTNVIEFIEKWGFDGLDLDWEYPVCWQVDCKKGFADEKEGFAALVRELSEQFKPRGLLLSSAVSPNKKVIDAGYDVPTLSQYFDWIAVMTYDYHGQWDKKTGHVAPMYTFPGDNPTFNANFSINYWLEQGADRKKIIMGMPMYGQSFSLADNKRHNLNAPTYGGGEAGDATRARGFLSYYEICKNIRERGWTVVRDRLGRMGPYAYHGDQWVSFDDASMIRHKSEYVKAMELGGAMIWALDLDDFRNVCDCETYPLLKTINRVLRNYPGPGPKCKLEDRAEIAPEIPDEPEMSTESTPVTWWPTQSSTQWWSASSTTSRTTARTTPRSTSRATARPTYPQRTTDRPTKAPMDLDLSCKGRTFVAHDEDCNKYYLCQFGMLMEQRCPPGLYWNRDHCDWPHNADCQIESQPQPPSSTSTTKRPTTPKPQRPSTVKPSKKPITSPPKRPDDHQKPIYPKPPLHDDGKYKVVCYFTNWAWYRPGEGKYTPNDIDENLCTHIVYGFAVLNRDSLTIKTHDSWADIDNRFYERVAEYRNKGIRVTLAIGGWNDSLGDKYSRLVRDPQARARFVKHVVEFLEKYGFEGLDLDWEYPVCWQVDCDKGFPDEKQGFSSLVRELSEEFKPRGLLLSAAVSPSKKVIDAGYDVPTLAKYFDWIAVMTYDFHGHWDKQTGHVAPLYYVPGDTYEYFNGNFSINYWIEKGAPPSKIIMGMPLYGQTFSLDDSTKRGLNSKAQGPGQAGKYTRAAGFLAYYEICEKVNNGGWTVVRDEEGRIGPYAYKDRQWVSYDDVEEIRRKSRFVKSMGLGGGMVWALDLDDFRGRCGCGKHPLLRTLNQELRAIQGQRASDCT